MELGSNSSSPSSNSSDSPLNGLKFGKKIYFENGGVGAPAKSGGGSSSSGLQPSATPKKGRNGVVQGGQPPRCQVEGCQADLSDAKAYYSRHKVCGTHSKSPKVIVAGLEQRFCQQCSRFHLLPEFDQGKRSCRRRLAGHNERRRKPPPGSLLSSHYGSLASSIIDTNTRAGGFIMDFTANPRLGGRDPWPITKASGRMSSTAPGKFIPNPWQNNSENPPPDLFLQVSASQTNYVGPGIPSGECFTGVSDSSCALSLLSNQPWSSRDRALSLGVNTLVSVNGTPLVQAATTHDASINNFSSTSWCFKDGEASSNSHETPPDIGLGQISQAANCQYPSELELAQQSGRQYVELEQSRAYDSPSQHMHWSL